MSSSTLYKINNNNKFLYESDFNNSWLFAPKVLSILSKKYLNKEFSFFDETISKIWEKRNEFTNDEKIVYYIASQIFFRFKDKQEVINSLITFRDSADEEYTLKERINEMLKALETLEDCKIFCFKNTSCDDSIENIFDDLENLGKIYVATIFPNRFIISSDLEITTINELDKALVKEPEKI